MVKLFLMVDEDINTKSDFGTTNEIPIEWIEENDDFEGNYIINLIEVPRLLHFFANTSQLFRASS